MLVRENTNISMKSLDQYSPEHTRFKRRQVAHQLRAMGDNLETSFHLSLHMERILPLNNWRNHLENIHMAIIKEFLHQLQM